jgi:hypothetical protein
MEGGHALEGMTSGKYIVYWDVMLPKLPNPSNTVVAYYKEVPTAGGPVATAAWQAKDSIKEMTPEQFKAAPKAGGPGVPGSTTAKVVELYDPRAEVVLEVIQNRPVFLTHCKVKYRFVGGRPQPGTWYAFQADMQGLSGAILKKAEGSTLPPEGEVEEKHLLREQVQYDLTELRQAKVKELQPHPSFPKKVEFRLFQGRGPGGPFRPTEGGVTCAVKVAASYKLP